MHIVPKGLQSLLRGRSLPLVLDGAMGTQLAAVAKNGGLNPSQVPFAAASEEGRAAIRKVSRGYCESGADIVCTATYNVSEVRYARGTDESRAKIPFLPEILRQAVVDAREVVNEFASQSNKSTPPLVAAVMGGYGVAAEPGADYDFDYDKVDMQTLVEFHRQRTSHLLAGEPDILLFETLTSFKEIRAIAEMLSLWKESSENAPLPEVWLACACRIGENGETLTGCGDSWKETLRFMNEIDEVSAVGINCTWPPICSALLQEAAQLTSKPLVMYPNNGTWHKDVMTWVPAAPEQFAKTVREMHDAISDLNVIAVGGCCCTGPEDIHALANVFHEK
eukprot:TRINITY_DN111376_c0_g1_i1.p1 TRINITY_DN111376_c0_g1~~TRINITY_DN111376_c0_g1_i1.p1  ORF type:complete len:336 (-),score=53.57 TRINITY_DN111376_c0_g1_i1:289-1296(-)